MAAQLYARIEDGTVAELWPPDPTAPLPEGVRTPSDAFGETFGSQFVPCGATVQQGWVTSDGGKTFAAPGPSAATPAQLAAWARAAWAALLAKGQTFNVAGPGAAALPVLCDGTNATRADLALLALFGEANPQGSKTWLDNAGKVTVLSGIELVTLATLAGNWVADTYPALATLLNEITAGTVTTTAQIDGYAWPTS